MQYRLSSNPGWQSSNVIVSLRDFNGYIVYVRDTMTGCQASLTVNVPPPSGAITGTAIASATTCAGLNNGYITVTPTGAGNFTYSLNNGPWQTDNVFLNLAPANYQVRIREGNTCISAPIDVTVVQGAGIVPALGVTNATCATAANGIIHVSLPAGAVAPFLVTINGQTISVSNHDFQIPDLVAGTYQITIVDAGSCSSIAPIPVTVAANSGITARYTVQPVACRNTNTGEIRVEMLNAGIAPYRFILNGSTVVNSNDGTARFAGLAASTNNTVVVEDAVGCSFTLNNISITEPAALSATANTSNVSCAAGVDGNISITATGGTAPYEYSLNNADFQADNNFTVAPGNYTVYVRDNAGCRTTVNAISITAPSVLQAQIMQSSNATCEGGNNGELHIQASGGTLPYSYALAGSTNFQTSPVLMVSPGTYSAQVRDANGCSISTATVTVGLTNNLVVTPMTDPAPICEGSSIELEVTTNGTQFLWTGAGANANTQRIRVSPTTTTVYSVSVSLGQCTATDDVTVQVLPAPVANAGADITICAGQSHQLQGSGGLQYIWAPQTNLDNYQISNPQVMLPAQTITYNLQVTDANNCTSLQADQVTVTVTPPIQLTVLPQDTIVHPGARVELVAQSSASLYQWYPIRYLNNAQVANPVFTAPAAGEIITYKVEANTPDGCRGEGETAMRVYAGPELYIPTAFSPNNDGKNDYLAPFPVGVKKLNFFRIFSRWGEVVFSTSELGRGWDGRIGGKQAPLGVYVWQAEAIMDGDIKISKQGTVTLIR